MARRTLEEILASEADVDHEKLRATTEEDIRRYMIEDGQDPDEELPAHMELVVPPRLVREKLGMSQEEFAKAIKGPVETLLEWERDHLRLDPAVRSLLAIIYRMPEALKALAA